MSGLDVHVETKLGDFRLDVAFEGPAAGVTAVFGPSGAGKSQLLAAIAGARRPRSGRIAVDGEVLFDSEEGIDRPMAARAVGWVFQDGRLFPHLSVEANLRYGERRARRRDAGVRFEEVLQVLGVGALLARRPAGLSGGERQRVAIGRALLSQPRLMLMDEPLAALDLPRREAILPYLERLKTLWRLPIVYVTHSPAEVVRLADRLVVLNEGRVRAAGPLAEVLAREDDPAGLGPDHALGVLDGVMGEVDAARGVGVVDLGGDDRLVVSLHGRSAPGPVAGARVRAVVLARDVLVGLEPPVNLSARNVLPAVLVSLRPSRAGVLATLRLKSGAALKAALTPDAVADLGLAPGRDVFAVVKSMAIQGMGGPDILAALDG